MKNSMSFPAASLPIKKNQQHVQPGRSGASFLAPMSVLRFSLCLLACGFAVNVAPAAFGETSGGSAEVDQLPELKKKVRYRIPTGSKKAGAEITLKFQVMEDGSVGNITVVKFTDPALIDPVYSAYEKAKYSPALKGGSPVTSWVTVTERIE